MVTVVDAPSEFDQGGAVTAAVSAPGGPPKVRRGVATKGGRRTSWAARWCVRWFSAYGSRSQYLPSSVVNGLNGVRRQNDGVWDMLKQRASVDP